MSYDSKTCWAPTRYNDLALADQRSPPFMTYHDCLSVLDAPEADEIDLLQLSL